MTQHYCKNTVKTSPEEVQSVTLNDRRNTRLSFVKANNYKVGLNLVKKYNNC